MVESVWALIVSSSVVNEHQPFVWFHIPLFGSFCKINVKPSLPQTPSWLNSYASMMYSFWVGKEDSRRWKCAVTVWRITKIEVVLWCVTYSPLSNRWSIKKTCSRRSWFKFYNVQVCVPALGRMHIHITFSAPRTTRAMQEVCARGIPWGTGRVERFLGQQKDSQPLSSGEEVDLYWTHARCSMGWECYWRASWHLYSI